MAYGIVNNIYIKENRIPLTCNFIGSKIAHIKAIIMYTRNQDRTSKHAILQNTICQNITGPQTPGWEFQSDNRTCVQCHFGTDICAYSIGENSTNAKAA
eukprot:15356078-Ditylum_brightwellii.AAC.1